MQPGLWLQAVYTGAQPPSPLRGLLHKPAQFHLLKVLLGLSCLYGVLILCQLEVPGLKETGNSQGKTQEKQSGPARP